MNNTTHQQMAVEGETVHGVVPGPPQRSACCLDADVTAGFKANASCGFTTCIITLVTESVSECFFTVEAERT